MWTSVLLVSVIAARSPHDKHSEAMYLSFNRCSTEWRRSATPPPSPCCLLDFVYPWMEYFLGHRKFIDSVIPHLQPH